LDGRPGSDRADRNLDALLLNDQPAGLMAVDPVTDGIVYVNARLAGMVGIPTTGIVGRSVERFFEFSSRTSESDGNCFLSSLTAAGGNRISVVVAVADLNFSGHDCIAYSIIQLSGKHAAGLTGEISGEMRDLALESSRDGIIMMDPDGLISYVSKAAADMFGYSASYMTGTDLHELLSPPEHLDAFRKGFSEFSGTGEGVVVGRNVEIDGLHSSGSTFPVELVVSALHQNDGWHSLGILRNITDRRKKELQLIDALEAAENGSRSRNEFLANVGHEVRTPLNALHGSLEMLSEMEHTEQGREYIEMSNAACERLGTIFDDVLYLARLETAGLQPESSVFDPGVLLRGICLPFSARSSEKGLEFSLDIADSMPHTALGDGDKIGRIAAYLLDNALKFTNSGRIAVTASAGPSESGEGSFDLEVEVSDTGPGIPPAKLESIFDGFTQVDYSHTRMHSGLGLGLALSSRLARLLGGTMHVSSSFGQGSTFRLRVPIGVHAELETLQPETAPAEGPMRILLADDAPDNRFLVKAFLRDIDCELEMAENGADAVSLFGNGNWDLILMDMQMPVMDGYEATSRIRDIERSNALSGVRIVALTAHTGAEEVARCLDAGCDSHLAKPVRKDVLLELISHPRSTGPDVEVGNEDLITVSIDPDLMSLVPGYLKHREEDVTKIGELLDIEDLESVRRLGHSMKGTGGGYGFDRITEIGAAIETAAAAADIETVRSETASLHDYLSKLEIKEGEE